MRRGTTPMLRFQTNYDWTGYELQLTLEDDDSELVFTNDRLTIVDQTDICITLTQEETLALNKTCKAQLRGKKDDNVIATDTTKIKVLPILNEEVM